MTKTYNLSTLGDFKDKDTTLRNNENTEILTKNETKGSADNKSKSIPVDESKFLELRNEIISLRRYVDAKLSDSQNKHTIRERKKRERNKRNIYIRDEIYPTCKKFQDSPNEPLKETIKKIFAAAEKYLELTSRQNNMNLFNHQKTLQENLES